MAALVPALAAGLASAVSAVSSKLKKGNRAKKRSASKAVVMYDPTFAAKQMSKMTPSRRRRPAQGGAAVVHVPRGHAGLSYRPTGLQSAAYIGRSTFSPCGAANSFADVSVDGSLKIRGRGLVGRTNQAGVINGQIIAANLLGNTNAIGTAATAVNTVGLIGPATLDPRLGAIAGIYSYYAIRKLNLSFVPSVSQYNYLTGTAPNASGSANLLTLGLTDQADYVFSTPPTSVQAVADLPCSTTGPAYQPVNLDYAHQGSRVYYTSGNGNTADINEHFQLALAGMWHGIPPAGTVNTLMGALHADWEVDFYRPIYSQTGVTTPSDEKNDYTPFNDVKADVKEALISEMKKPDVKGTVTSDKAGMVYNTAAARSNHAQPTSPTASLDGAVLVSKRDYAAVLKHVKESPSGPPPLVRMPA